MKMLKIILGLIYILIWPNFKLSANVKPELSNVKAVVSPKPPDTKIAVPGTPYYRTVGTKGYAIQCLYPFNRHCILLLKADIDLGDEPCLSQYGMSQPILGELIEPSTIHLGLYDENGVLIYRDITNSVKTINCDSGYFEIVFPEGY